MNLLRSLQTALNNLRVNKLRSSLTMLGVIIGVSAVIIMVAIVEGARAKVVGEFERLGSKLIIVAWEYDSTEQRGRTNTIDGLTMQDLRNIQSQCDLVQSASAEVRAASDATTRYLERETKADIVGVMPEYARLRSAELTEGRFLNDDDLNQWGKVCVIGEKVRKALYPSGDAVGRQITVQDVTHTVVGVLSPKGKTGDGDPDKSILLPITTVQKRYTGRDAVHVIWAQPYDVKMVTPAMDQIWQTLMRTHDNAPGFRVDSQENILNAIGRILTIFGLLLGGVAGLALLVGGIGVMNIMLVSVTERTREIGIRKAVGARSKDILQQFLIESATVTGVGGLIGIGLGWGVSLAISAVSKQLMSGGMGGEPGINVHLPLWAVAGAFGFSAFVGIFFGMYPAVRASRLDPITALRHE
jgi:putative ABC transport system permease protein